MLVRRRETPIEAALAELSITAKADATVLPTMDARNRRYLRVALHFV